MILSIDSSSAPEADSDTVVVVDVYPAISSTNLNEVIPFGGEPELTRYETITMLPPTNPLPIISLPKYI